MTYVFDIDGTLCTLVDGNYSQAQPLTERIKKVNKLATTGHTIVLHTARGMNRFEGNTFKCHSEFYLFTERQLKKWGVMYDQLIMGKPSADFYIDDKGVKDEHFFVN